MRELNIFFLKLIGICKLNSERKFKIIINLIMILMISFKYFQNYQMMWYEYIKTKEIKKYNCYLLISKYKINLIN